MTDDVEDLDEIGAPPGDVWADPHSPAAARVSAADHDDDPDDPDFAPGEDRSEGGRLRRSRDPGGARWPADANAPDYAHLQTEAAARLAPPARFALSAETLDLLIAANRFEPRRLDGLIVFALRGARLLDGVMVEGARRVELEDVRPNHSDMLCTLGYYAPETGRISAYLGSTVPNARAVREHHWRSIDKRRPDGRKYARSNMLPTGCYRYLIGGHRINKPSGVFPALRLGDPATGEEPAQGKKIVVALRSRNNMRYEHDDHWDPGHPYDNVHCAYSSTRFNSRGCLTVCGHPRDPDPERSPWLRFQTVLDRLNKQHRAQGPDGGAAKIDLVLLTGREAAIAAQLVEDAALDGRAVDPALRAACLDRLRHGSRGPDVEAMQSVIETGVDGQFGQGTRMALIAAQRRSGALASDGVFSPRSADAFGLDLFRTDPPAEAQPAPPRPEAEPEREPANPTPTPPSETAPPPARPPIAPRQPPAAPPAIAKRPSIPIETAQLDALLRTTGTRSKNRREAQDAIIEAIVDKADEVLTPRGINANPRRLCMFLAQVKHESGNFRLLHEGLRHSASSLQRASPSRFKSHEQAQRLIDEAEALGVPRDVHIANTIYGGRMGNTKIGDGWRYRGRGLIQLTGRNNYKAIGERAGLALEKNPDLAAEHEHILLLAAAYWESRGHASMKGQLLNGLSDAGDMVEVTRIINGGRTGIDDRRKAFRAAWDIWGTGRLPDEPSVHSFYRRRRPPFKRGGTDFRRLQDFQWRLAALSGKPQPEREADGDFGGRTLAMVLEFQEANGLPTTGVAGERLIEMVAERARERGLVRPPRRSPRQLPPGAPWPERRTAPSDDFPAPDPRFSRQLGAVLLAMAALAILVIAVAQLGRTDGVERAGVAAGALLAVAAFLVVTRPARRTPRDRELAAPPPEESEDEDDLAPLPPHWREPIPDVHEDEDEPDPQSAAADQARPDQPRPDPVLPTAPALEPTAGPLAPPPTSAARARLGPEPFLVTEPNSRFAVVMLFGGDNNLTQTTDYVMQDLEEMAIAARGDVSVIGLADYYDEPARIVEVTPDGRLRTVQRLPEIDTGDPRTLTDFLSRALRTYGGARKAIGFWDHGTGVFDETDPDEDLMRHRGGPRADRRRPQRARPARRLFVPEARRAEWSKSRLTRAMLHDSQSGGVLTTLEARRVLETAYERADLPGPIDMLFSDACLNGMIEVLEELGPQSEVVVGSPDTEPGDGWDYDGWLGGSPERAPRDAAEWARQAVDAFDAYYRDRDHDHPCTLGAFSSDNQIAERFAVLVERARAETLGFSMLRDARDNTVNFDGRDAYDLVGFAVQLQQAAALRGAEGLARAAQDLAQACGEAHIAAIAHGPTAVGSHGLGFWFPSTLSSLRADLATYRRLRFAQITGWAAYLEENWGRVRA